jgi:hypothetical protein
VPKHFLTSYRPLCRHSAGRRAAEARWLAPFIDGSCRREPDFEARFPSITAICRSANFAPRLYEGDRVAYYAVKAKYAAHGTRHRCLVALLEVIKRCESHDGAAAWYSSRGLSLPSNLLVPGNPPKPLEETNHEPPGNLKRLMPRMAAGKVVELWDAQYRTRALKWGVVLVCRPIWLDVWTPPVLSESTLQQIFGKVPATRTPPSIEASEFERLREFATHQAG